jgi:hypothetical protein
VKISSIINKALYYIMKIFKELYIVFIQALYLCEVIDKEEMEKVRVSSDYRFVIYPSTVPMRSDRQRRNGKS